ncbi:MAG: DUF2911 domain-containing protein [Gemmatimonadaceae bacterium]
MRTTLVKCLAVLAASLPTGAAAQSGGFLVRLGNDTIAMERYERTATRIDGTVLRRSPATTLVKYSISLNSDGSIASYEQSTLRADGTPTPNAPVPLRMTFTADSVLRHVTQNGQPAILRAAAPKGTLPQVGLSWLANELLVQTARRIGAAYVIGFGAQQAAPVKADIRFIGTDSAEIVQAGFRTGVKLDGQGRVIRGDGALTTQKFIATPVPNVDVASIASAWAARDASGAAMGAASTRDTMNAMVGGASVWIDYGRPAKRGREIWGKLVPYDTTWRFGANAATQLRTDKDLDIGGVTVPAGTYTLWLYPTAREAWLIVNKQTGQWGTAYDANQDLVRIPVTPHMSLRESEERFRIFVQGNMLMMHWDKGGYGVRMAAK